MFLIQLNYYDVLCFGEIYDMNSLHTSVIPNFSLKKRVMGLMEETIYARMPLNVDEINQKSDGTCGRDLNMDEINHGTQSYVTWVLKNYWICPEFD